MKKAVSILLCMVIILSCGTALCAEPEKTKAQLVQEFMASVCVGSYNTPQVDGEEDIKNLAENGVKFVLLFNWSVRGNMAKTVEWCEKYGVYCIIESIWPELPDEEIRTRLRSEMSQSPAVIGHYIVDEPSAAKFERMAKVVEIYNEECPGMIPYINLLPQYASLEQLGTATYDEHISEYIRIVNTDYVCTDIYPLLATETRVDWLTNLAIVQKNCHENGKDIWQFILGEGHLGYRNPSYEDYLNQSYMSLAFGVTKIMNFCYATPPSGTKDGWSEGSVTEYGEKTPLYDITAKVNKEINSIAPVLQKYKNVGTGLSKPTEGRMPFFVYEYLRYFEPYTGFDSDFKTLSSQQTVITGCYENESGERAVIFVNSDELLRKNTTQVTFSFATPQTVTAYPDGVKTVLTPDENGVFTLDLGIGDGILTEYTEKEIMPSDVNFDGNVSLVDAMLSFMGVAGRRSLSYYEKCAADQNGDGVVELSDAMKLFLTVAGK